MVKHPLLLPILSAFLFSQDSTDIELDLDAMWETTVWIEIQDVVDVVRIGALGALGALLPQALLPDRQNMASMAVR